MTLKPADYLMFTSLNVRPHLPRKPTKEEEKHGKRRKSSSAALKSGYMVYKDYVPVHYCSTTYVFLIAAESHV